MHEEDDRPPNEKSHAYHFIISYNGWDFCLLTPSAICALLNEYLKDGVLNFVVSFAYDHVLVIAIEINRHCTKMSAKKDAKHKKLLNLLCIVYFKVRFLHGAHTNTLLRRFHC